MGHIYRHLQGHILGVFRPGLLPTGRADSVIFIPIVPTSMTWGDTTAVQWGDGTQVEWSGRDWQFLNEQRDGRLLLESGDILLIER